MGVDSKVFVVAPYEQSMTIGKAVLDSIDQWLRAHIDREVETLGFPDRMAFMVSGYNKDDKGRSRWSISTSVNTNNFQSFQYNFNIAGDARTLWYFTECSCETDKITPEYTLLFSIGAWGTNEEIMQTVIQALKPFGRVYYDYNDCDSVEYELQRDYIPQK